MKKIIMMVALLSATSFGISASVNSEVMENTTVVVDQQGGYIYKGVLATVYVDSSQNQFTVTVPSPSDNITGCAPGRFQLSNNGSTMTIKGWLIDLDLYNAPSGSTAYFEVGGQQPNGDIVVYQINVVVK